jgi:hypothetical protein
MTVLVGEFTKPPVIWSASGWSCVICESPGWACGSMWLFSRTKTAAAQCTGQRRVVLPQGENPGCGKPLVCADFSQDVLLPVPPPPPFPLPSTTSLRRLIWSHMGFPKSLQALSGRRSDQRSSLQKPIASRMSLSVEINRAKVAYYCNYCSFLRSSLVDPASPYTLQITTQ